MNSLESAYLPFMLDETNITQIEGSDNNRNSPGLKSSHKRKFAIDSAKVTSISFQSAVLSHHRLDATSLSSSGMTF